MKRKRSYTLRDSCVFFLPLMVMVGYSSLYFFADHMTQKGYPVWATQVFIGVFHLYLFRYMMVNSFIEWLNRDVFIGKGYSKKNGFQERDVKKALAALSFQVDSLLTKKGLHVDATFFLEATESPMRQEEAILEKASQIHDALKHFKGIEIAKLQIHTMYQNTLVVVQPPNNRLSLGKVFRDKKEKVRQA